MRYYLASLQVLGPFVIGVLLVVLAAVGPAGQFQLYVPIAGPFLAFQYNASGLIVRVLLLLFALGLFATPAFQNYASWLPAYMRFEMFFDAHRIDETLRGLSEQERNALGIEQGWREYQEQYLRNLNESLRELASASPVHVEFTSQSHGSGEFVYRVRSVKGWQKYQLDEAWGYARFSFTGNQNETTTLFCLVTKIPTSEDRIRVSFTDIFIRGSKILRPRVRLDMPTSPFTASYIAEVLATTKVHIFPIPTIGETLYLVDKADIQGIAATHLERPMVPIAYGIYSAD